MNVNNTFLAGISGKKNSGKDTLGRMLQGRVYQVNRDIKDEFAIKEINHSHTTLETVSHIKIKKFADKLKTVAGEMLGVSPKRFEDPEFKKSKLGEEWNKLEFDGIGGYNEKPMTVREFLQKLGTEAVRKGLHRNAWVNALFAEFDRDSNWIITDVRFKNEANAIKEHGGYMVRINRPDMIGDRDKHPSETALDNYKYFDHIFENDGDLYDLYKKVKDWEPINEFAKQLENNR